MIVPAIALGAFVVFAIGYIMTRVIAGKIADRIEERKRKRTGLIPSLENTPDMDMISITGGIVAVVLVLILFLAVPRESKALIWYILTAIGIIFGILTFLLSESDPHATRPMKTPVAGPVYVQDPKPPQGKEDPYQNQQHTKQDLYQRLLSKTRNDRDLADRLIEYERKRNPGLSETELIKNAIERLERDNR